MGRFYRSMMVLGALGLGGCFGGILLRIPVVPPIVDCSNPEYQLDNSVRSLMSWSNNYQDQIDQGRNVADACAKALSYRGSANCIDPSDPYVRRALRDTLDACEVGGDTRGGGGVEESNSSEETRDDSAEDDGTEEPGTGDESDTGDTDGEPDGARNFESDPALGPGHVAPPKTDDKKDAPEGEDNSDDEEGGSAPEPE